MAAAIGLQPARHRRPDTAEQGSPDHRQRQQRIPGQQPVQCQDHKPDPEPADIGLSFAADIEQPGMEGDRDGKAGEDEIGRVIERVADGLVIAESPVEHDVQRFDRVFAERQDDKGGDRERGEDVQGRDNPDIDPFRKLDRLAHAALSPSGLP